MNNASYNERSVGRSMTLFNKREIGNKYEALANQYLSRQGLNLIEHNFTTKFGEIDLIMRDKDTTVFVEVKYRKHNKFGDAAEFVNHSKRLKLIKTAYVWLSRQNRSPHSTSFRFDVVAIHQDGTDINWIKNAITQD